MKEVHFHDKIICYLPFDNKCNENKYKIKIFEKIINNCCIIKRDIARLLFGVKIEYPTPL